MIRLFVINTDYPIGKLARFIWVTIRVFSPVKIKSVLHVIFCHIFLQSVCII